MKDVYVWMLIYNLTEYSDNYSKTFGRSRQYYRDEPSNSIKDSKLFTFIPGLSNNTKNAGTISVEIVVPLKYLSSFWRLLEMSLINCESYSKLIRKLCHFQGKQRNNLKKVKYTLLSKTIFEVLM